MSELFRLSQKVPIKCFLNREFDDGSKIEGSVSCQDVQDILNNIRQNVNEETNYLRNTTYGGFETIDVGDNKIIYKMVLDLAPPDNHSIYDEVIFHFQNNDIIID